jgi:hypothetical protein
MTPSSQKKTSDAAFGWRPLRHAAKSWFGLTQQERFAILVVLGIFLLGAATRWWLGRT